MIEKVLGYQGTDAIEQEDEVIVCPNPKCGYIHVDEYGDTMVMGEPVKEGNKYAYFKCYKCKTILFASRTNHEDEDRVPFWLIKKMKVRKTWHLARLEEETNKQAA